MVKEREKLLKYSYKYVNNVRFEWKVVAFYIYIYLS